MNRIKDTGESIELEIRRGVTTEIRLTIPDYDLTVWSVRARLHPPVDSELDVVDLTVTRVPDTMDQVSIVLSSSRTAALTAGWQIGASLVRDAVPPETDPIVRPLVYGPILLTAGPPA